MELLLIFETSHGTIAAERALLDTGIPVRVMPVPGEITAGCGLGLRIDEGDFAAAAALLADSRAMFRAVYGIGQGEYFQWGE